MTSRIRSLNAYVGVPALLDLLECRSPLQGLPLRTRCPVCRKGLLTIYRDYASEGGWHHCETCGSHGDLIALAAASLKISLSEAICFLAARGFALPTDENSITQYEREHVQYDAALNELWKNSRIKLGASPRSFSVTDGHPYHCLSHQSDELNSVLGEFSKTAVERTFAPTVMHNALLRNETGSTSSFRVFHGNDWLNIVGMAFFDLPGRISAFLFTGRKANPKQDYVLKRANRGPRGNDTPVDAEAGLAFHPGVFEAMDATDGTIVAVNDPLLMHKLQSRSGTSWGQILPIVTWIDTDQWPHWQILGRRTRTQSAWQMFFPYKVVFWAPLGIDVLTLRQAIRTDGWISTAGPRCKTPAEFAKYLAHQRPTLTWRRVVEQARPWSEALSAELAECKAAALDRWLIQMQHDEQSVDAVLGRCTVAVQQRIRQATDRSTWARTIELNRRTVVEVNRSWWFQKNGRQTELICDAILRVDRIVTPEHTSEHFVEGRILFREHEVPLLAPLKSFEEDVFGQMRDLLLKHELGLLRFNPGCSKHAMQIATSFQPPRQNAVLHRVGFDLGNQELILPAFTLAPGGHVSPRTYPLVPEYLPGENIRAPAALSPATLKFITRSSEPNELLWATTACCLANILAYQCDSVPAGICLAGCGAQSIGMAVAEVLGCRRLNIARSADVRRALNAEHVHDWPIAFDCKPQLLSRCMRKLFEDRGQSRRCILGVDLLTSKLLLLSPGWNVIFGTEDLALSDNQRQGLEEFLPAYLRDVVGRWCCLQGAPSAALLAWRILDDIAEFIKDQGGKAKVVVAAADRVQSAESVQGSAALLLLLGELVVYGTLRLVPPPKPLANSHVKPTLGANDESALKWKLIDDRARNVLVLAPSALVAALSKIPAPQADVIRITELLEASGFMRNADHRGWVLDREAVLAYWKTNGLDVQPPDPGQ